jgi:hypothetical protein
MHLCAARKKIGNSERVRNGDEKKPFEKFERNRYAGEVLIIGIVA